MNKSKLTAALAALAVGGGAGAAQAAHPSFEAGDWTVTLDGNVNGFLSYADCENPGSAASVRGGLACVATDTTDVRTGLLPAKLGVAVSRSMGGWDTKAYVSYWPGIDSGQGPDGALGANTANFRQVYFQFGNDEVGTFKIGRDLGVFGSEAILNDQTLLGVGAVGITRPLRGGRTSLGGIGTGYIYPDWKAQVQYMSPKVNGFQLTAALVDSWNAGSLANPVGPRGNQIPSVSAIGGDGKAPGFEAELKYTWSGPVSGAVWTSGATQRVNAAVGTAGAVNSEQVFAGDIGAKASMAGLTGVLYAYYGDGAGTTGFLLDGFDANGNKRDSYGGYAQVSYKLPGAGTKLSAAYALSKLSDNSGDPGTLVNDNQRVTGGIYHPITSDVNLVLEANWIQAENHNNNDNDEFNLNAGGIMFF